MRAKIESMWKLRPRRLAAPSVWTRVVCCLLWLTVSAPAGLARQQVPSRDALPVYRAGVELVVLNVAVLDKDGEPVTDLGARDFRMLQDGRPQEITLFARSEDTPLDVALVLDASGSIRQNAPQRPPGRDGVCGGAGAA